MTANPSNPIANQVKANDSPTIPNFLDFLFLAKMIAKIPVTIPINAAIAPGSPVIKSGMDSAPVTTAMMASAEAFSRFFIFLKKNDFAKIDFFSDTCSLFGRGVSACETGIAIDNELIINKNIAVMNVILNVILLLLNRIIFWCNLQRIS